MFQYKRRGNHVLCGEVKTTVNALLGSVEQTLTLSGEKATGWGKRRAVRTRALYVKKCCFVEKASFLQFVQKGLELNFMVAIDFTGSNGDPSTPNSLHYINPALYAQGQLNQCARLFSLRRRYERAIAMIGNVIEFYDTDRLFPVYGFGACLPGNLSANHCFALNFNEANPEVPGVAGVMTVYHQVIPTLRFSGPTYFAGVLGKAARWVWDV